MSEFDMIAEVQTPRGTTRIPVIVMYEHDNGKPYVYGVFEAADQSNDLTTHISDTEHELIYFKVEREINQTQSEAEELAAEGER